MRRDMLVSAITASIATPLLFGSIAYTTAQVMQSTNYRLSQDSINFAGGLSTSTSYSVESTAGEVATGDRASTNYQLRGGYQQLDTSYIAITPAADVVMTPAIGGITGGTANGSTTVTVITDSPSGYTLSIKASDSPALKKGSDSIANYVPAGDPDFSFSVAAGQARFGYSPSGAHITQRFKDNGASCNAGTGDTLAACWDGLSVSDVQIAGDTSPNVPSGTPTVLYFRTGIGNQVTQPSGLYTATTTVTALAI